MKKITLLLILLAVHQWLMAQNIGIGTTAPHASAQLDVTSSNKGLLTPRMRTQARTAIASPANGLLVFDSTTTSFWFYNGAAWIEMNTSSSSGWGLTGNAGTNPAVNFIGTTDNNDIIFKRNNIIAGSIGTTNTGYGLDALNPAGTGVGNSAYGTRALNSNTTGAANTANGYQALNFNTTGDANTASGNYALYNNTDGNNSTANGYFALYSNTTGSGNTANGYQSLYYNTTGDTNTANGYRALFHNTTGIYNVANGYGALYSNLTGTRNTATGTNALFSNTIGKHNTANGFQALYFNTTGDYNTANGVYALYSNTTGDTNTAIGYQALYNNTTGSKNIAMGDNALYFNTTGDYNTANGVYALYSNSTGDTNTAFGHYALYSNIDGDRNTAGGFSALRANISGDYNTAFGYNALSNTITGSYNTAIGFETGPVSGAAGPGWNNTTAIGYMAQIFSGSNSIRIGNSAVTLIQGNVPFTTFSDGRFKTNVTETVKGLDFIMKLRPVVYNFQAKKMDEFISGKPSSDKRFAGLDYTEVENMRQSGFIAQEVEKAALITGYDFNGVHVPKNGKQTYSLAYSQFVVPLVKAIQEQQTIIQNQQKQIDELKGLVNKLMTGNSVK